MSHADPTHPWPVDDVLFPFIDDDFDWDAFFNFEPEADNPSDSRQDGSLTQWEPLSLSSAPQDQPPSLAPATGPGAPRSSVNRANSPPMVGSSASSQLATKGDAINQNPTKRGIQEFLSSFFIDDSSVLQSSKRQAFPPDRRTEVAKVRKIKACQRCKMRKLSCQANGVCRNCIISVAENVALGEQICFRCTLVNLRFSSGDLLRQSQSRDNIDKLPLRTHSILRTIFVWFRTEFIDKALQLEVEDYAESLDDKDQPMVFDISGNNPSQPQFSSLPNPKYLITNQSLPSVTQLDEWIQQQVDRRKSGWSPATRLFNSFHMVLDILCNTTSDIPTKSFSKAALQITNLYECWRNVLSDDRSQLQTATSYISRAAGFQLALIAKQGIADCEIQILSKLDDLIQKSKRPSKESELSIWAGVWTLVLLYRTILRHYSHLSRCVASDSLAKTRLGYEHSIFLARQMYNALTSTYNLLFRKMSPLNLDWKDDENFARIGRNTAIRDLLNLINEQTQVMYDRSFDLGEDDNILQCLIAEEKYTALSPPSHSLTYSAIGETSVSCVGGFLDYIADSGRGEAREERGWGAAPWSGGRGGAREKWGWDADDSDCGDWGWAL